MIEKNKDKPFDFCTFFFFFSVRNYLDPYNYCNLFILSEWMMLIMTIDGQEGHCCGVLHCCNIPK